MDPSDLIKLDLIQTARTELEQLAQAPKGPKVIDVLRLLRPQIREVLRSGRRGSSVHAILTKCGFNWSESAFFDAWKQFLAEEKLASTRPAAARPEGPVSRGTPALQRTASYSPPSGSALEALSRASVSDLLRQQL